MTPIPTAYPEPSNGAACTEWEVFEACWRCYQRGETGPVEGGVLARTLASELGTSRDVAREWCQALTEQGVFTRLDTISPLTNVPCSSWAPTALVETREEAVPGRSR